MREALETEERWGVSANPESREAAEAYVRDHRYAEQMDIDFTILRPARTGVPSTQGGFLASDSILPTGGSSGNATKTFSPAEIIEIHRWAVLRDIDFWMF